MLASKNGQIIQINPLMTREYMANYWTFLDDNGNVLEDPLAYAKEELAPKTVEIPIVSPTEIKKVQSDIEYLAMMTDTPMDS